MILLRSLAYMMVFYVVTALFMVLGIWLLLAPRSWAMAGLRAHARTALWLLRWIVGTSVEIRGLEHLPEGPFLIASKHQSAWDTFALVPIFKDPALVMKAELMLIPFYGWFSRKFGMIPVQREAGSSALRGMLQASVARIESGRQILVFPEGTRRAPYDEPDYKPGILMLYGKLGVPCVPVALNSGLFWPRRSIMRYPGTIIVELLEPIPAGLKRTAFANRLEAAIETATTRLVDEALMTSNPMQIVKPESEQTGT